MSLKITVPTKPFADISFYWLERYDKRLDIEDGMPFITIRNDAEEIEGEKGRYWTLDSKLHNFFRYYNINYTLVYSAYKQYRWHIDISDKDALLFKLCWIDAEYVYNNF
jgi:hypothetical protein